MGNKLLLVDLSGTILTPLSGGKFIQHPKDQRIIKGADKAIAHYHKEGWVIVGIANQGGVAAGHKQLADAIAQQQHTLELLPLMIAIYFCPDFLGNHCWLIPSDKRFDAVPIHLAWWAEEFIGTFRKPQPGMLKTAIRNHMVGEMTDSNCWYIGNSWEDEEAAMRVGVQYMDADIWRERFQRDEHKVNAITTNTETQLVINWLKDIIPLFFEPLRNRGDDLINRLYLESSSLNYIGMRLFEDLTDYLDCPYQPPEIEIEIVKWETVGRFLVENLGLDL